MQVPLGWKVKQNAATRKANVNAHKFLKENRLAKIVVILDTHSTRDGDFVTGLQLTKDKDVHTHSDFLAGVRSENVQLYFTDGGGKIIERFIPEDVAKILASPRKVDHSHGIFILNATCGMPVLREEARLRLLAG